MQELNQPIPAQAMLTENWEPLAETARTIYKSSLSKTLELFPFDDDVLETYKKLPSAIGGSVTDFGLPAKFPIDEYRKALSKNDAKITEMEPTDLIYAIKAGKYTCVQVLKSYFHAAVLASKLVNCVFEFLPEQALRKAQYLDRNLEKLVNDLPLYGLPLSLKEMIPVNGHSVTHGSLCYLDRKVDYDADIVKILMDSGSVPFVRTTNPQSLMMLECESLTHGRTVNPFNSDLTCGGSSGGEGAINGIHASPVGLGSDIGGSIRCPSAFNGIYGMRTTLGRLPTADYFSCQMGSESILSVTGPLTRSLETLELLLKTVIDSKPWLIDPSLSPVEWKGPTSTKKLRIGIMRSDGLVHPHPPILRALEIVRKALESLPNVEVFDYDPYEHDKGWKIVSSLYFEDGGEDTKKTLTATGEPMCPQTAWALNSTAVKSLTIHDQWKWNLEKQAYRKRYLHHWMNFNNPNGDEPMDAIVAPVFPGVAAKHRTARYWGYTAQWNLLDYPVLVFPVTKIDIDKDKPFVKYNPLNGMDEFQFQQYDDPKSFENAPVNLGLVGLRFTEEKLIDIGKILKACMKQD